MICNLGDPMSLRHPVLDVWKNGYLVFLIWESVSIWGSVLICVHVCESVVVVCESFVIVVESEVGDYKKKYSIPV